MGEDHLVNEPTDRLAEILDGLQVRLEGDLRGNKVTNSHPVALGSSTESDWLRLFRAHLPLRYQADRAFVVDSKGACSEQIDIVIHDRQYSPCLYNHSGELYVPAESVYAVVEVKQDLNRDHVLYAGNKAASVRKLFRTSAEIPYAAGAYKARPLPRIVAGLVTYQSSWTPPFGDALKKVVSELSPEGQLDVGCALLHGVFEVQQNKDNSPELIIIEGQRSLAQFFMRLLKQLQVLATVPAIDYEAYLKRFSNEQHMR